MSLPWLYFVLCSMGTLKDKKFARWSGPQSASLADTQWGNDRYLKQGRDLTCLRWLEDGQAQKTLGSSLETINSQNQQAQRCTELNCCGTWQVRMENRSPPDRLPGFVYDSLHIDPSPEAEYWVQCQNQGATLRVQRLFPMIADLLML